MNEIIELLLLMANKYELTAGHVSVKDKTKPKILLSNIKQQQITKNKKRERECVDGSNKRWEQQWLTGDWYLARLSRVGVE